MLQSLTDNDRDAERILKMSLMLLSKGIFAPGKPLFYIGCGLLICALIAVIIYILLRKPQFANVQQDGPEALINRTGVVCETVDGDAGTGLVRVCDEEWAARAVYTDDVLEEGTEVTVVAIEGVKLIVRPL